jgi:hypothetical protein
LEEVASTGLLGELIVSAGEAQPVKTKTDTASAPKIFSLLICPPVSACKKSR